MQLTNIEWCDESWNPVTGCTPMGPGCQNCYARIMATRLRGMKKAPWMNREFSQVRFHPERLKGPYSRKRAKTIFCVSMGDLFHEKVTDEQIGYVMQVMVDNPRHRFIVLTKRPARMWQYLKARGKPTNLWPGFSAENQDALEQRLIVPPAGIRQIISFEPLLGQIDLWKFSSTVQQSIAWVIAGAEQGSGARPMKDQWAFPVFSWATQLETPFFFKKPTKGAPVASWMRTREFPW